MEYSTGGDAEVARILAEQAARQQAAIARIVEQIRDVAGEHMTPSAVVGAICYLFYGLHDKQYPDARITLNLMSADGYDHRAVSLEDIANQLTASD
jgi:hypothetical protein